MIKNPNKIADEEQSKSQKEIFTWTNSEIEPILEAVKVFSTNCSFEGKDWESVKSKYDEIRQLFAERYPNSPEEIISEEYPKFQSLETIKKDIIAAKLKSIRKNYKKAVDKGNRSGGGRVVMTFYDLCQDIWAGAPATTSENRRYEYFCMVLSIMHWKRLV